VNSNFVVETSSLLTTIGNGGGSAALAFKSNNTTNMTLDASGNVGIGTTTPTGLLNVKSTYVSDATTQTRLEDNTGCSLDFGSTASGHKWINSRDTAAGTAVPMLFQTGGTERMRIDSIGAVTMPYQPAFLARPTGTQADIPASTTVTVVFGTEVFDQNADFASNTFTAPVTGKYQFSYSLYLTNIDTAAAYYEVELVTSNRSYPFVIDPNFASDLNYLTITPSVLADMDAGDTAYVTIRQQTGTAQTDISNISFFSGYLVA
jgi:hypothetical protein